MAASVSRDTRCPISVEVRHDAASDLRRLGLGETSCTRSSHSIRGISASTAGVSDHPGRVGRRLVSGRALAVRCCGLGRWSMRCSRSGVWRCRQARTSSPSRMSWTTPMVAAEHDHEALIVVDHPRVVRIFAAPARRMPGTCPGRRVPSPRIDAGDRSPRASLPADRTARSSR
jgi:hypothetical protein